MERVEYAVAPGWWHGLAPLSFGWEDCAPGHTFGPAVRHYHLLHYVLEGEGTFQQGGALHQVRAGDLFVIRPEEVTTYSSSAGRPWDYVWLGFQAGEAPPFLQTPVIRQPPVRDIFEQLRDQCQDAHQDGRVFALLYELLWRLSQAAPAPQREPSAYAAYARAYLETSYMQQVSIQKLADSLHIDRRYLTLLFKEAYGQPPQAYLMSLRLAQARQFLERGYGVSQAASLAGFTDLSNFSRQYKRQFGQSPSAHRGQGELPYPST